MSQNTPIELIVGLGNPGKEYILHRHNVGFWLLDALCKQFHVALKNEPKLFGQLAESIISGRKIRFFTPNTYMNESGKSVLAIQKYFDIQISSILIAHDDLDLPFGRIQFKTGGGHGGHNGVRNIIAAVGDPNFHRVRIGIGHPGTKEAVSDYVLSAPPKTEALSIENTIQTVCLNIEDLLGDNRQNAITKINSYTSQL